MSGTGGNTLAEVEAVARARGLVVRTQGPFELFLDLDNRTACVNADRAYDLLKRRGLASSTVRTPSPSGNPFHAHQVITLTRMVDAAERIALQAMCGSDPFHELLSWSHVQDGGDCPTVFFERPGFERSGPTTPDDEITDF